MALKSAQDPRKQHTMLPDFTCCGRR